MLLPPPRAPHYARLIQAAIKPRVTRKPMLERPKKSSGLFGLKQNIRASGYLDL
jgi:hypothetical protein